MSRGRRIKTTHSCCGTKATTSLVMVYVLGIVMMEKLAQHVTATISCPAAMPLALTDTSNGGVFDEITNAVTAITTPLTSPVPGCAFVSEYDASWFLVVGNGNLFTVSTCTEETQVYTILNVLQGSCLEETSSFFPALTCTRTLTTLTTRDCAYGNLASSASWKTSPGVTYRILVSSPDDSEGRFGLVLWELPPPSNNVCQSATPVLPNGILTVGSTVSASNDLEQDSCAVFSDSRGVWFRMEGTRDNDVITASTCNGITDFDTSMSVFQASSDDGDNNDMCDSLICLGFNDDGESSSNNNDNPDASPSCGSKSAFTWELEEGTTYYILVQGFGAQEVGTFGLIVTHVTATSGGGTVDLPNAPPDQNSNNVPPNDNCGGAIGPLTPVGKIIVEGTLQGATVDGTVVSLCGDEYRDPAVWYSVIGTGRVIVASTCTGDATTVTDTILSVLVEEESNSTRNEGEDICNPNNLQCVGGNDNDSQCIGSFRSSTFAWQSQLNQQYYILVHGNSDEPEFGSGPFGLIVEDLTPPVNDICSNAKIMSMTDDGISGGDLELGTTLEATRDIDPCQGNSTETVGVWYSVIGTGQTLSVSTCSETTNYGTQLSIMTSSQTSNSASCEEDLLQCVTVGEPDESCSSTIIGDTAQVASWESMVGITYHILVHGRLGTRGEFELRVRTDETGRVEGRPGSSCMTALGPMGTNETETMVFGSTQEVRSPGLEDVSFCGIARESPGIWYFVEGTGTGLRASTCHDKTDYDTALSVYVSNQDGGDDGSGGNNNNTGDEEDGTVFCSSLQCMGGDDNDLHCGLSGLSSTLSWASEVGQRYYILVHGAHKEVGNFALTVTAFDVAHNDDCTAAEGPIPTDGSPILSSTEHGTVDTVDRVFHCGGFVGLGAPGVWYSVVGTGTRLTASTCSEFTEFNTAISVFSGELCGFTNLKCVGGNDDDYRGCSSFFGTSTFSWPSEQGQVYHILIHGGYFADISESFAPAYGLFSLTVHSEAE